MTTPELLQNLRAKPSMYIGRPCMRSLQVFLSGYNLAMLETDPEIYRFWNEFSTWVHKRYRVYSSQHWSRIIEFYSLTEAGEMDLFWKLIDEFDGKAGGRRPSAGALQFVPAGNKVAYINDCPEFAFPTIITNGKDLLTREEEVVQ